MTASPIPAGKGLRTAGTTAYCPIHRTERRRPAEQGGVFCACRVGGAAALSAAARPEAERDRDAGAWSRVPQGYSFDRRCIPRQTASAVIGRLEHETPVACRTASAIAGQGVLITTSPMDFAPKGPVGSQSGSKAT